MSFFIPRRLTCFLCDRIIGERVEAAQLPYAHPDDVGELARHGRGWVHRACWSQSSLRPQWAQSAVRLLATDPANLVIEGVVCRRSASSMLLQDPLLAVSLSVLLDQVEALSWASERGGEVVTGSAGSAGSARWSFSLAGDLIVATAESGGEVFERFELPAGRWARALGPARVPGAEAGSG